ncbi:site-specific DNA-methyltransferase [Sphingomonas histidinilytica]|uniref:Methyltransferase n=2 Tax=Rhizorhabdus histidinilytica TaxID=439228 RepID=A0A1T5E1Z7_9SPHN|nr:site-specific DNA-methyltransferase [Rhizorhabdus histidinilytica]MBO9378034.1 site-specific DNA-methyltransferase [Rhizorhabdus histidinilytica]SKB77935.1 site-specific DNA-methyltransferase (adenine-specific) [Rhizorhabdus histidinilytica]
MSGTGGGIEGCAAAIPILDPVALGQADWAAADLIVRASARAALDAMPAGSAHVAVTSPPYYGQRDYGVDGQIGIEPDPDAYVAALVAVFRALRRVLRDDGTLWLNLGDKYAGGVLLGMPWRVALALVADGWKLRSDIVWHKPNAMPHSNKRRPTHDHEYVFLLSKTDDYRYDADAIREPHRTFGPDSRMRGGRGHFGRRGGTPERGKNGGDANLHDGRWDQAFHPLGRNRRTVWSVPLGKYRDAHFAVFPPALITPCIRAGSPAGGVVLDPFFGAGTTGLVARAEGRRFVGIELNPDYCAMARDRILAGGPAGAGRVPA